MDRPRKMIFPLDFRSLPRRILLSDPNPARHTGLVEKFQHDEIPVESVSSVWPLVKRVAEEAFGVCVLCPPTDGGDPAELIVHIRRNSKHPDIKIILTSPEAEKDVMLQLIEAGASDFVTEPVETEILHDRILYHLIPKQVMKPGGFEKAEMDADSAVFLDQLLAATELLSRVHSGKEYLALHQVLKQIAEKLGSNRTSLVRVDEKNQMGLVLASSDDAKFHDFPIDLKKYPEILQVIYSGDFLLIDDVSRNNLTQNIGASLQTIQIGSLMVFPVRFRGVTRGVLTIRRPKASELPTTAILRVLQALANAMATHLIVMP